MNPRTPEGRAEIMAWFDLRDFCGVCNGQVLKTEWAAGLHEHPPVMD